MTKVLSMIVLVALFSFCEGHTSIEDHQNKIIFKAAPKHLSLRLGGTLTLRCEIPPKYTTGWTNYKAILISRVGPDEFPQTVATISSIDKDQPLCGAGVDAKIFGHLDKTEGGYLKVDLENYSLKNAGIYFCFVKGRDASSFEETLRKKIEITAEKPTLEKLTSYLFSLKDQLDKNSNGIKSLNFDKAPVMDVQKNQELINKLQELGGIQALKIKHNLNLLYDIAFVQSGLYNNHFYRLSVVYNQGIYKSQEICEAMGGYLAEINDRAEYLFIQQFIKSQPNPKPDFVFLGLSDKEQESKWVFLKNKSDPVYLNFSPGEPNRGKLENYMALFRGVDYRYVDIGPTGSSSSKFLCEIPHN